MHVTTIPVRTVAHVGGASAGRSSGVARISDALTEDAVSRDVLRTGRPRGRRPRPVPARVIRARRMWVAVIGAAVLAIAAPQAFASGESAGPATSAFDTYTVAPGESLWSIASALTTPGDNVHETVATIQEINQLPSSAVRAGEQLFIPTLD